MRSIFSTVDGSPRRQARTHVVLRVFYLIDSNVLLRVAIHGAWALFSIHGFYAM
jgi:hypothetical protein